MSERIVLKSLYSFDKSKSRTRKNGHCVVVVQQTQFEQCFFFIFFKKTIFIFSFEGRKTSHRIIFVNGHRSIIIVRELVPRGQLPSFSSTRYFVAGAIATRLQNHVRDATSVFRNKHRHRLMRHLQRLVSLIAPITNHRDTTCHKKIRTRDTTIPGNAPGSHLAQISRANHVDHTSLLRPRPNNDCIVRNIQTYVACIDRVGNRYNGGKWRKIGKCLHFVRKKKKKKITCISIWCYSFLNKMCC